MNSNNKKDVHEAFYKAVTQHQRQFAKVGAILAAILVPAGVFLDYFIYPEKLGLFFTLRLTCILAMISALVLYETEYGKNHVKSITFSWIIAIQITLCMMIYSVDGASSTYYAGLNLVILGTGIILPLTVMDVSLFCIATLVLYLVACLTNTSAIVDNRILINNIYFIVLTSVISTTAVYFNSRSRFAEFRLTYELAQLDKLKSEFFANISHELRTPLTLIMAPIEDLIKDKSLCPAETNKIFHTIRTNTLRLLRLVNNILDVTRLEEGKTKLDSKPIDINIILNGIIDSVSHHAKSQGIEIRKSLLNTPLVINGDQYALEKIFLNLLGNSIKFTNKGGYINVSSQLEGKEVKISIDDNGIGINKDELPYIFDRFHQADGSSTRKYTGTGLGLALVKELTEQQQGRVVVTSQPDVGTKTSIIFPHSKATPIIINNPAINTDIFIRENHDSHAETINNRKHTKLTSPTLLIVDDEKDMLDYLCNTLSPDYIIQQSSDGKDAWNKIQKNHPDLVLLDLMLPHIDGLELCRRIKQDSNYQGTKVMLLTARVDEDLKNKST